jgi:hypothetical protein
MKDFKLDEGRDLMISGNDLVIDTSDEQHREHLLLMEKGSIKQYPQAGVGLASFLEDDDVAGLLREIAVQFSADGMQVKKVALENNQLIIDSPYK